VYVFSVIVPTCNRPDALSICLDALHPSFQTEAPAYEVIVTDDGASPLAEAVKAAYPWVRFTAGPRRGPAANRNHGASIARGRWLVFTDDDCIPDRWLLDSYHRAIQEHPAANAFEGSISPLGDLDRDLADCPVNETGGMFWSANVCLNRAFFESVGRFDDGFPLPAHEDQDLYLRIKTETAVPFVRAANVKHPVRQLKLRNVLRDIDKRNVTWVYFSTKNAARLKYRNKADILAAGYATHIKGALFSLRRRYVKKLIYHGVMVSIGMPMQAARLLMAPQVQKRA
jgi:glycosyltransferase involved in cell wall biosynthesis